MLRFLFRAQSYENKTLYMHYVLRFSLSKAKRAVRVSEVCDRFDAFWNSGFCGGESSASDGGTIFFVYAYKKQESRPLFVFVEDGIPG